MADKGTLEAIEKLKRERPRNLLDSMMVAQGELVVGLRFLVDDFREQANLVMESGARGKGAEATALRGTASHLSLLADAVEKVDLAAGAVEPAPSRGGRSVPVLWCGKTDDHGPHLWPVSEPAGPARECPGREKRDLSGLNALVAERAAKDATPAPAHTMTVERVEMPDYLKAPNPELESYLRGDELTPAPEVFRTNTPELKEQAAAMFAAPTPPGRAAGPEMPGRRLTFAELLAPPPVAPPEHMSYSQVGGMSCGTQYRLSRLEPGVIERPRWANVGGTGLHLAVEWFERAVANARGNAQFVQDRIKVAGGIEKIWTDHFGNAVVEQSMKTPSVPPEQWKESGRHVKEGYTWWLTQGEDMLRRYLDGRLVELETPSPASSRRIEFSPDGVPMIEHEGTLMVEGVPVKVVLDQVWRTSLDGGALVIEDVKSGGWAPDGTFQLGLYAWYLRRALGWEGQILGRFYDARKGTYGEPVDLIEAHPWEEVQLRVLPEAAKKKALLFSPNPAFGGCKSCMVSHACPAAKATS